MDALQEIFQTIQRNKLRTFLTALSVAWGMFMLVVLFGAGKGLEHGAAYEFRDDAVNSMWVFTGKTTMPYAGRGPGREIKLNNEDYRVLPENVPGIDHITGRFYLWGEFQVSYGSKHAAFDIRGTHPGHLYLEKTIITAGRFLDELDLSERRKVAVLGSKVVEFLFGTRDPIGEYVNIRGVQYRVVGVFEDVGGENELKKIYVPITTAQLVYNQPARIHQLMFTIGDATLEKSQAMSEATARVLAARHGVSPDDKRALHVQNNFEQFTRINVIFVWIRIFVWIVGSGTLFAGIIGISNIMLISVRERTREIGIRKALGATPTAIVAMILGEAVLVTATAGYSGLVAGILVVELAARSLHDVPYLRSPEVDFSLALIATGLLVLAGVVAGFFPARQAALVRPVEALKA